MIMRRVTVPVSPEVKSHVSRDPCLFSSSWFTIHGEGGVVGKGEASAIGATAGLTRTRKDGGKKETGSRLCGLSSST